MVIEMKYWYLVQMVNVRLANLNDNLADEYKEYKFNGTKHALRFKKSVGSSVSILKESLAGKFVGLNFEHQ